MNAYAEIPEGLHLLTSADISAIFKRAPDYFSRARTRRKLYGQGFPHPIGSNRWSASAVRQWLESPKGQNPEGELPPRGGRGRRRRARRPSNAAYAEVTR